MNERLDDLRRQHRRLNRIIDNCRAVARQEEMKMLKRLRLRIKDRIDALQRQAQPSG